MQLSINNVSMRFGARILFEDVNTTFISGRRYAITGPNGAGKSTLMKIQTGEIDSEKVRWPGQRKWECRDRINSPLTRIG